MVQAFDQAGQVTNPVAIRVAERARIDLVDDTPLPPGRSGLFERGRVGQGVGAGVGAGLLTVPLPRRTMPVMVA